jgi:DNA-binding NarL/FixJ family response regulator
MLMSSTRILVVDDHESWRRFVYSTLKNHAEYRIIGEASDGIEAIQNAQELQPDLIVLDIGLPKLNGIEAARQIRKIAPTSKILFLSSDYSPDIAAEALSAGASGYVVKSDAGIELLAAVDALREGEQFVSARFASHDFSDARDSQARFEQFPDNSGHG